MVRGFHDSGFTIAISRAPTPIDRAPVRAPPAVDTSRALMMNVRLGDIRHRILIDEEIARDQKWDIGRGYGETACGISYAGKPYAAIDAGWSTVFPTGERVTPCTMGCFSARELKHAAEMRLIEDDRIAAKAAADEADRVESNELAKRHRQEADERVREYKRTAEIAALEKPESEDE